MLMLLLIFLVKSVDFVYGILGGTDIDIEDVPYHLNYGDICGAVLIDRKWAITTAHCGKLDYIRIGDKHRTRGSKVIVKRHIVHPKFGIKHDFDYDIQLLELKRKLRISRRVMMVSINDGVKGKYISIAGWGYMKEKGWYQNILQQVKLKLVPFKHCQNVDKKWFNHTLTDRMFCAGGDMKHDACQGDSGGGAVSSGELVGIASFGFGCGRNIPGVYINVSETSIRQFIRKHTGV